MQRRYALRFENGERRGEVVDLVGGGATLGRRPGSTVQILDASVSGRHAELAIDERGVLLRDLGSTNGTRVGAERISERRLAHGDHVLVGNVRFLFIDRQVDADPPLTESDVDVAGIVGSAEAAGDAVHTISAQKVAAARSPRRSAFVLLLGLAVVAGAAAGGWMWWQGRAGGETGSVAGSAVVPVAGNLLQGSYSFEGGAA
ncbi:MAG TPA: FHA domain-containing protein, partial [Candidatus Limnocylindrales bacterium]|nr:FHA domain-containing protein [Candidatus Limnocylindrales bacterium]